MKLWSFLLIVVAFAAHQQGTEAKYDPTWDSLDSRPLPQWYDDAKIGIFIHFGVYSVPSFKSEWFWCYWKCPGRIQQDVVDFMKNNYPPNFTYQDFAKDFTLEFFDAKQWIDLFAKAGAKYAVLTSKHHEGYTLWPSKHSFSWNSMDVGPQRDIVGEFCKAAKDSKVVRCGLYHSLFEWFNPLFSEDSKNNFTTRTYAETKAIPELYELVNNYQPDVIWSDGDPAPVEYWQSREFLAWLYNDSPVKDTVAVNDRWGDGTSCKHGGFLNCQDRYDPGTKQSRKWENAMTLDRYSWGNRRNTNLGDIVSIDELIALLVKTVSNGGNLLVDVGPTKEGTIPVIMQERLLQMGEWLSVNGEAIYSTKKWDKAWNDTVTPNVFYTSAKDDSAVFASFLQWPANETIALGAVTPSAETQIVLLGQNKPLQYKPRGTQGVDVQLPSLSTVQNLKHGWSLKITQLPKVTMSIV